MNAVRRERDLLGERDVPADALWGIHTLRAVENFPLAGRGVHVALIHAFGEVKLACARCNHRLGRWDEETFAAIVGACEELVAGKLDDALRVDALQGGAGTSTNMNVNEVLCNRALQLLGAVPGRYDRLHPIDDLNLHQSTNDAYPTALKVAVIRSFESLRVEVEALRDAFFERARTFAHVVKVGRTQLQDAVLMTVGQEMRAWGKAFARDVRRCERSRDRLRVVNLGGTAIGTGIGAPQAFVETVVSDLVDVTGIDLAQADDLVDATQNTDVYAEVAGSLKGTAANLMKVAGDLRFLSSGPRGGLGEIHLPAMQAGSSIMPGKINPVVPEAVTQVALKIMANEFLVALASGMGSLELNHYMPLIADGMLTSLDLLVRICRVFREKCVEGLEVDEARCRQHVREGAAMATLLVEDLGYRKAQALCKEADAAGRPILELAVERGFLSVDQVEELCSAERVDGRRGKSLPQEG